MNLRHQWPVLPLVAGLASGLLTGCGSDDGGASSNGDKIVVGMSDDVLATDPASGYDPGSWLLFNNVFQSLLGFPKGGTEPQPDAAESCEFTDTSTKVFRCTLRDGLKFSNGDALTSEDVKFSFDRTLKIDDPDGPAVMFSTLEKVDTPDEKTVVFTLNTADATFPSKIASGAGAIVNHREYDANGLREDGKAVGSGPYKLDSFDDNKAVFSVNQHYSGSAETKNSGVTLSFFHGDQNGLKKALEKGEVDIAYRGLTAQAINDIEEADRGDGGIEVVEGSSAEVQHLVFNMDDPVAGRLGVRKAIAHLLDRDALMHDVYRNTATPLYSIIPAGVAGHNTAFFDIYGARPSKAKAEAALRNEGITDKVKLTLWSTPARYGPATDQELEAIAKQLNASGLFDADVKSVEFAQYEKDIAAGTYGVYVKGWVPDYPDADNFTGPFFGEGNVLDNNYDPGAITKTLLPRTAAESDRGSTDKEFERIQNQVAEDIPSCRSGRASSTPSSRTASTAWSTASTPRPSSGSGSSARADPSVHDVGRPPGREGAPTPCTATRALLGAGTHQPALVRVHRGLHPVAQSQLGQHMTDVRLHGGLADEQVGGDLRVGQPARHQLQHLDLAVGQRVQGVRHRLLAGRQMRGVLVQQPARDARGEHRLTGGHHTDRLHQLVGRGVLEQEAARPGLQRLHHVLVEVERRQHQDLRRPVPLRAGDLAGGLHPVHPRHTDVHQDHVGLQRPYLVQGLKAVTGLADDREVLLGLQNHPEPGAQQRLVVDQ